MEISRSAQEVLRRRYLAKDEQGQLTESIDGMFRRVAREVASADARFGGDIMATEQRFYELMTRLEFLPNSPTLMNAGRQLGQLSACFVLPVGDSMEEIFDAVKNAALIQKSGGGTGFSFSRLRPAGSPVLSTGGVASGPVSFMRVFNTATEAVKQGGTRRGANMGTLRVDHPDILEFIDCKSDKTEFTNFNISIGLTDAFMQAVLNNSDYQLTDPLENTSDGAYAGSSAAGTLNAEEVFQRIVKAAWRDGEPGIIFLDRLNQFNTLGDIALFEATNPCGEQPLLPYESCNLGSINLVQMLMPVDKTGSAGTGGAAEAEREPGAAAYQIDWAKLARTVSDAVHFLDNVIEVNRFPLSQVTEASMASRKIGLGVMGFADMLIRLGIPYASLQAVELAKQLMAFINDTGHKASEGLAVQRGAFPLFGQSSYAKAGSKPLRNATVTTIAPTGTLSIIAGCSSGIEPVFGYVFVRRILDGEEFVEVNPALLELLAEAGLADDDLLRQIAQSGSIQEVSQIPAGIREVCQTAHDISPEYHVRMQAAFQQHTDNAVSKTVNLPSSASPKDVANVFMQAYGEGCKGVTIYRDGSRDSQPQSVQPQSEQPLASTGDTASPPTQGYGQITPRPRPTVTSGFTERMKTGCGNLYVTVNFDQNGICEVFTSTGKAGGCPSQSEAAARLASIALRSGISVAEVCSQLKGIRCPSTIRQDGMSCTSCPDAIARVLLKVDAHIKSGRPLTASAIEPSPLLKRSSQRGTRPGLSPDEGEPMAEALGIRPASQPLPSVCPECNSRLEHEGGCVICRDCGYSKCN